MDTKGQLLKTGHVETINASDFQARCLEILDRVSATGERVVILKRGRHEMVHFLERDHNDRFRELMDRAIPQWRLHRDELNRAPLAHEEWRY